MTQDYFTQYKPSMLIHVQLFLQRLICYWLFSIRDDASRKITNSFRTNHKYRKNTKMSYEIQKGV